MDLGVGVAVGQPAAAATWEKVRLRSGIAARSSAVKATRTYPTCAPAARARPIAAAARATRPSASSPAMATMVGW